jgi:hypothetical protein
MRPDVHLPGATQRCGGCQREVALAAKLVVMTGSGGDPRAQVERVVAYVGQQSLGGRELGPIRSGAGEFGRGGAPVGGREVG